MGSQDFQVLESRCLVSDFGCRVKTLQFSSPLDCEQLFLAGLSVHILKDSELVTAGLELSGAVYDRLVQL